MANKKTEPMIATFLHRKGGKLGIPIGGTFELTARCNFDCPMCYVHLKQNDIDARGKELTAQQWIDIAQEARDAGMVFALLTGGEPFVRKDFFEIYNAMKAMGLLISINTNGSMLEGDRLQKLLDNPPFRINVSLYGGCNKTYRDMCGQDAFERVVRNIRALKGAGVEVRLNLSITPYNRQDLTKIYEIARELGIQVKANAYMYPPIRVNQNQFGCADRLTPEEAAECMVQWDQLRFTEEEFALRAENLWDLMPDEMSECSADLEEGVGCRAGHSSFWVAWDGTMLPCAMLPSVSAPMMEIGFTKAWEQIRSGIRALRMPASCANCSMRPACGVCAAVCLTENGATDRTPEYMCKMTAASIEGLWKVYNERKAREQ
jgi:radical SAM protein with 4Fe4S-binding SPASM domain